MNKTIDTVVDDIYQVLSEGVEEISSEVIDKFANQLAQTIKDKLLKQPPREFTLRMSNIGKPCSRQLWLEKNYPDNKEPMTPNTLLKFLYGDLAEEMVIFLAEVAGHNIEGRQDEQSVAGIKGHRDLVLDGVVTDVKSCSSYSFEKFKNHLTRDEDAFGYLPQLGGYVHSGQTDDIVTDKSRGAFLAFDKVNGNLCLDTHPYDPETPWELAYETRKEIVNGDTIPPRAYELVPDGYKNYKTGEFIENGSKKLPMNCSYCAQKYSCYDTIRTFLSSKGPVYYTEVKHKPKMVEIDREGNRIDTGSD